MSPLSISLPAPAIEWEEEVYAPWATSNPLSEPLVASSLAATMATRGAKSGPWVLDSNATVASFVLHGWGARGGGGTIQRYNQRDGFGAILTQTSGASVGEGMCPPSFAGAWGDPADYSPGSLLDPAGVVCVWDFNVCMTNTVIPVPTWANDGGGVFFLPQGGSPSGFDVQTSTPQGGATARGGFGFFLNNVAGAARWEYVAWATGGAILERITVPLSMVAAVNRWTGFRFIMESTRPTKRARLTVQVNGFDLLVAREFGSAELQTPQAAAAAAGSVAAGWVGCYCALTNAAFDGFFIKTSVKLGRFTPDGAEQQAE
ncbi:MAG: hypothetical protein AB7N73_15025 [Gemmatimonadales bacterium]